VSEALRKAPPSKRDLRYGARPRATLDFFPGGKENAPLFVFIHGGYWQRNEKERFSFTALGPLAHGINVAVPGYTLAPDATLTDIVAEIRAALTWLALNARRLVGRRPSHRGGRRPPGGARRHPDQRHLRSRADRARRAQRPVAAQRGRSRKA
jgi:acetyl esterase/lipase